jgi:hypothetical protein
MFLHRLHPLIRQRPGASAPARLLSAVAAGAPPPAPAAAARAPPASSSAAAAAAAAGPDLFYDPALRLSRRQRDVFARLDSVPRPPPQADHGFQYGLTAQDLAGASEPVRRALSTRTGNLECLRRFRTAQIVEAVGGSAANSGASRVQGA